MTTFLFHFSALIVLPFWVMMIFRPHLTLTEKMVRSPWIILPPIICYLAFLIPNLPQAMMLFQNPSPESLAKLMSEPWSASMFWAYAGAFDLFVGRWIFFDARKKEISHWVVSPILFVCIFFGPLAFAIYAITHKFCNHKTLQK